MAGLAIVREHARPQFDPLALVLGDRNAAHVLIGDANPGALGL